MSPFGQATRRVDARRVAAYVVAASLAGFVGSIPHSSFAADDLGNVAEIETGLVSNLADGQAIFLRLRESLAARDSRIRAFTLDALLGAFKLGLGAPHLGAGLLLRIARHRRRLFAGSADTFRR